MRTFQVQLWPGGKWDGMGYQKVEADTTQEAAEKLYGHPLLLTGSNHQLRALVHELGIWPRGIATAFYEVRT
ncbi:MAG: hypothetical protein WAL59_24620 [Roseiarcus sp.]